MKSYPAFKLDNLLAEIQEWMDLLSKGQMAELTPNDMATIILNDPKYKTICAFAQATQEALNTLNVTLLTAGGEAGRQVILRGQAFMPLLIQLISLGYSLALREQAVQNSENSVSVKTRLTH